MESVFAHLASAKQFVIQKLETYGVTSVGQASRATQGPNSDLPHYDTSPSSPIPAPAGDTEIIVNPDFPEYGPTHNEISKDLLEERQGLRDQFEELGGIGILAPGSDTTPAEREQAKDLLREIFSLNDDIKTNVLQQTAPILILPEGQGNLPADPASFIAEAQLKKDNGIGDGLSWGGIFTDPFGNRDDLIRDNTDGNPDTDFAPSELTGLDSDHYLDVDGDTIVNIGSEDAPIFYQTDLNGDPPRVSYHVFYPYNDGPYVQNHEGDFETVTVHLNPNTLQPEYLSYSAHGGVTSIPYEDVPKDPITGQPQIFVAGGSHANYAEPGSYDTNVPSSATMTIDGVEVTVTDPNLQDHTASDVNGDGRINASDGAVVIDTSDQLESVTDQEWYPENGHEGPKYGEQGDAIANDVGPVVGIPALGSDGPTGLSGDKGHLDLNLGGH